MNKEIFRSAASVLRARSTVIVGASEHSAWAKIIFSTLRRFEFPGEIQLINPKYSELWDLPCYPNFSALPKPPDHALMVIPAPAVLAALEEGTKSGLKAATIYAANLGEGASTEIISRGITLKELCRRTGLLVAGPNCMGSMSMRERYFAYPNFPDSELCALPAGSVAGIFQSGGTLQVWAKVAADRGIRFSYLISSGNELNLDLADYLNFAIEDEFTKIIVLFIEGIRRPDVFMTAAAKALAAGKPIIAIKTGKSQPSRDAAQTHTGAIAGDYDVFAAMCERYGISLCGTLDDIVELVLAFQPGRLPKGGRVGVFTTSGGTVDLLHDCIEEVCHLSAPPFDETTTAQIRALVPAEISIKNPFDGGNPAGDKNAAAICRAIISDPKVDMLAWAGQLPTGNASRDPLVLREMFDATDKPVICFSRLHHGLDAHSITFQQLAGIPFLQDIGASFRALSALKRYGARCGREIEPLPEPKGHADELTADRFQTILAQRGLTLPATAFAKNPEEAGRAATEVGFPVALKIVSPEFTHKTEIGGVRLHLRSAADVGHEARDMASNLNRIDPRARIDGFLIQAMVDGPELILGARTDPLYGPVLLLGSGGTMVELLGDSVFRLLPVGPDIAREMIGELKVAKALNGYRNRPACDIEALVGAICGLSALYLDFRHLLNELEINPLIVMPRGQGVRAVDVRPVFKTIGDTIFPEQLLRTP